MICWITNISACFFLKKQHTHIAKKVNLKSTKALFDQLKHALRPHYIPTKIRSMHNEPHIGQFCKTRNRNRSIFIRCVVYFLQRTKQVWRQGINSMVKTTMNQSEVEPQNYSCWSRTIVSEQRTHIARYARLRNGVKIANEQKFPWQRLICSRA